MTKSYDLVHELTNTAGVFGRNKEVSLIFEGDGARTDGKEIALPSLPQNMEFSQEETMVFRGYLDHEAGHVRHTNFEDFRKFRENASEEAGAIHNCLEDMWLEKKVMEEYPGAEKNLRKLTEVMVEEREKPAVEAKPELFAGKPTVEGICNAILRTGRYEYGGDGNKEMFHAMPVKYQEWGKVWAKAAHEAKDTKELINIALEIEKLLDSTPKSEDMNEDKKDGEGLAGNPEDFSFDPDGDVTEGKGKKKSKEGRQVEVKLGDTNGFVEEWVQSKEDSYLKSKGGGLTTYKVFTTRYDEVYERNKTPTYKSRIQDSMSKTSSSEYEIRKQKLGGIVNTMKSRLRRALLAKEMRDWDFGREYGRLDSKRIVAGSLGAQNVYKMRKDRYEMDTAVHFLVDLSGSMGGAKIEVACNSVIALSECLEGTQIKFQITGFSNYGTPSEVYGKVDESGYWDRIEPLRLHKFKKFEESLQVAKGSIAAIANAAGGNNSDRDAVIWAYQELKKRPEKRKILFVLSDGQPANRQVNSRNCLEKALKEAVIDCSKAGVECVGIGIKDTTVLSIYPKAVSIRDVNDLSGTIFNQLSNLLTGGKVQF